MRDIQKTIEQAANLGSHKRINMQEICELRNRSVKQRDVNVWDLIMNSYDFGFALGYKLGAKGKG